MPSKDDEVYAIPDAVSAGYALCVQFFNTLREIKFQKHPFESVCLNLHKSPDGKHKLHVMTYQNTDIKLDDILRHYVSGDPTINDIKRHATLFSYFADLNIHHTAQCLNKVRKHFKKDGNTEDAVVLYFKYILCVSCVAIMTNCYTISDDSHKHISYELPICSDTICPAFQDIVQSLPDGLRYSQLHLAILLYHMTSQLINYIDAASVIKTTTVANEHTPVAEQTKIISHHENFLKDVKYTYAEIKTITAHPDTDIAIVNTSVSHKAYLTTPVEYHTEHIHKHIHKDGHRTHTDIILPPHTAKNSIPTQRK